MRTSSRQQMTIESLVRSYIYISQLVLFVIDKYVDWRQYKTVKSTLSVPEEIVDIYDQKKFEKAKNYEQEKSRFSAVKSFYNAIVLFLFIKYNGIAQLYNYSSYLTQSIFRLNPNNEFYVNVVFLTLTLVISSIESLPFSLYYTFVLEEKYGFNKQTLKFFIKDKAKNLAVSIVIINVVSTIVVYVIMLSGDYVYIYTPIAIFAIQIFIVSIYQDYIAPIFDKFKPLKKGQLYDKIEKLVTDIKFPLGRVLVVEGSQRSSHSNAYFIGIFGKRTIVLYDTLFENLNDYIERDDVSSATETKETATTTSTKLHCSDDEIIAILAHELGHWSHMHILKNLLLSMIETTVLFYVFGKLSGYPPIYRANGFFNSQPILIGMILNFCFIFSPISFLTGLLSTCLSRMFEFQADEFSVNLGHGDQLGSSLKVLSVSNLSFPIYDIVYSTMNYSHPPLLQRLNYIKAMTDKRK